MEFPTLINWTNPFEVKISRGSKFQVHSNCLKVHSLSKQYRAWSDTASYDVWSGSALFVDVP